MPDGSPFQWDTPPGWYQDPESAGIARWWDGNGWTNNRTAAATVSPQVVRPQASVPTYAPRPPVNITAICLLMGGVLGAIGCFLPWATLRAVFIGQLSRTGLETSDGKIAIGIALVAGAVGIWAALTPQRSSQVGAGVAGVLAGVAMAGLATIDGLDASRRFADINDGSGLASAEVGPGLYLLGLGGVIVLIAAVTLLTRDQPRTPAELS